MNLFSHSGIDIDPRPFVLLDVYHHFSEIIALGLMAYQRLEIIGERRSSEAELPLSP